jgi:hypothetical protein
MSANPAQTSRTCHLSCHDDDVKEIFKLRADIHVNGWMARVDPPFLQLIMKKTEKDTDCEVLRTVV